MSKPLLLIVDDQPSMGELVADVAEDLGFDTITTANAKQFQTAYLESDPLAIVMDIVMPDMDGNELLEWLANKNSHTPVVIMSGFEGKYVELAQMLAVERGAIVIGTLVKPFLIEELEMLLNEILNSLE